MASNPKPTGQPAATTQTTTELSLLDKIVENGRLGQSREEKAKGKVDYNYTMTEFPSEEAPGLSAFTKGDNGEVLHTYSSYARGLDILIGTYNFLDMAPKGRDESALPWSMAWVRRHDEYEATLPKGGCCS